MRVSLSAPAAAFFLWNSLAGAAPKGFEKPYKTGVQLENAGNVVDALAMFEGIPTSARDFDTRLHIASCKRKLGRLLAAEQDYEAIRSDPSADEPTRDTVASDLDDVRARIPNMKITLAPSATGVVVEVDGAPVAVPTTKSVDPGAHVVIARRDGASVFERRLELTEGTTVAVVVDAPAVVAARERTPVPPPDAPAPGRGASSPTTAWVFTGAAVASFAAGGYFLLRATSLRDQRDDLASRGDPGALDSAADARTMQTVARVGFGVGVLASGAAAYLFLASRKPEPAMPSAGVRIAPAIAMTWGLTIEGAW